MPRLLEPNLSVNITAETSRQLAALSHAKQLPIEQVVERAVDVMFTVSGVLDAPNMVPGDPVLASCRFDKDQTLTVSRRPVDAADPQ